MGSLLDFIVIAFYSIIQGKEVNEIAEKFVSVITFIMLLSYNV